MNRNNSNTDMATAAARHRSLHAQPTVPFIVRRHADAFALQQSPTVPSIDSLWDMTLLDRLQMPLSRRFE